MLKVLFLGRANHSHTLRALAFCRRHFETSDHLGLWGEIVPEEVFWWTGDVIISFLSRWILPPSLLESAKLAALNFHPGPPEYPGIGCVNFALYQNASMYGATAHLMDAGVDSGSIVRVKRFPVLPDDNVETLLDRTHDYMLSLFYDVASELTAGSGAVDKSNERWMRKPFTRAELNELCALSPDMTPEEMARRERATSYKEWHPEMHINGKRFTMKA